MFYGMCIEKGESTNSFKVQLYIYIYIYEINILTSFKLKIITIYFLKKNKNKNHTTHPFASKEKVCKIKKTSKCEKRKCKVVL